MAEGRRFHELEILLILRGRSTGNLIDPLANVFVAESAKPGKGREKLIVATEPWCGHIAAQRERIDKPVVEILLGGRQDARKVGSRHKRRGAGRLLNSQRFGIDAQAVDAGVLDEGLGIDSSAEMDMEIGALGKLVQEGVKRQRSGLDGGLVGTRGTGLWRNLRRERKGSKQEYRKRGNPARQDFHRCFPY